MLTYTTSTPVQVVDGTVNNAFPGLAKCSDGSLLATWRAASTHGESNSAVIKAARSTDDGATWGTPFTIFNTGEDSRSPMLTLLSDGSLTLCTATTDGAGDYAVSVATSTDDGDTWSALADLPFTWTGIVSTAGAVVELTDGTLVAPGYGGNTGVTNWSAATLRSTDDGATWSDLAVIANGVADSRVYSEPCIGILPSGDLMALIRCDTTGTTYRSVSTDGGLTWGTLTGTFTSSGRPEWVVLNDAVIAFTRSTSGSGSNQFCISTDNGATWGTQTPFGATPVDTATYAQAVEISTGVLGVAYSVQSSLSHATVSYLTLTEGPALMSYSDEILADTPAMYLRLDETSGTTAADSSGNSRTGTYVNSPALAQTSLLPVGGGTAVAFDGTNDRASVAHNSALNAVTGSGFTLSFWVKINSPTADKAQVIIDKSGTSNSSTNGQWSVYWDDRVSQGSPLRLNVIFGRAVSPISWSGTTARDALAAGGYFQLRYRTAGSPQAQIFWNGVEVATANPTQNMVSTNTRQIDIGCVNGATSPSLFLDGTVDEIALWPTTALSDARLTAHYTAATTTPTIPATTLALPVTAGLSVTAKTIAKTSLALAASVGLAFAVTPVARTTVALPVSAGLSFEASSFESGTTTLDLPVTAGLSFAASTVARTSVDLPVAAGLSFAATQVHGTTLSMPVSAGLSFAVGGVQSTTLALPVTAGLSFEATGGDARPAAWTADQSQRALVQIEPTGGPLTVLPPIAGPPPVPFVERSIMRVSHLMPTLTPDANGRVHADGTHDIITEEVGVPHLFVSNRDVTYFRGVPVLLSEWSSSSPGGDETAAVEFPQITPWDQTGTGDLSWLKADAPAEIYLVKDGARVLPAMFCGHMVSDNAGITQTDLRSGWHLEGTIAQADSVGHRVPVYLDTTDLGTLAAKALNEVISHRYANVKAVTTGIPSRYRGQYGDTELDYLQALLAKAWTPAGQQWTVMRGTAPRTFRIALKDLTTVHHEVTAGTPGVEIDLVADQSTVIHAVYGRWRTPEGGSGANWKYPGLRDTAIPDYPYASAGTVMSIGSTDAGTLTGEGVSLWQERARALGKRIAVDGVFSGADADAARDIQARFGILIDGIVGPQTWNATFESGVNAGNFNNAYRAPLSVDPRVEPLLYSADGGQLGPNPAYDKSIIRREVDIDFGTGTTRTQATRDADLLRKRSADAGLTGTVTFRGSDPIGGSRFLMFENQNLQVNGWRGADPLLHIAEARKSLDDDLTVTLTVDSKARDALSLSAIRERDRDAKADPAGRPGNVNRRSRGEQDITAEWDDDSGAGVIEKRALYPGLPAMVRVPVSQIGSLSKVEMFTSHSAARFAFSMWGAPIQPTQYRRGVGHPLTSDDPYGDVSADFLDKHGFIEGWGQSGQACGYWPKSEAKSAPVTGVFKEAADLKYRSLKGALVWVILEADRPCFIWGRLYPAPVI